MNRTRDGAQIPIKVARDDPEPMYRQIEAQLRALIVGGQLPAGTPLPTIRALAQDLSCSVITTRQAYQNLEGSGLTWTRQGVGTVVAEVGTEELQQYRLETVLAAFREAIEAGLRVDYPPEELRAIFRMALEQALAEAARSRRWC